MVKNKCLICGKEWESRLKGKWCSGNCWNKAHHKRMREVMDTFMEKEGGHLKYQNPKKKWAGTFICPKCEKKGRRYILFKNHQKYPQLHFMHFKGKNRSYDYNCYIGKCDNDGNQINEGVKDDGGF